MRITTTTVTQILTFISSGVEKTSLHPTYDGKVTAKFLEVTDLGNPFVRNSIDDLYINMNML
jgi:hypothetical protein